MTAALNKIMKERIASHSYALSGVGGTEGCLLQIVKDEGITGLKDVQSLLQSNNENPVNAIKIRLEKLSTVSEAINMTKLIREQTNQQASNKKIALVLSCEEDGYADGDTFLADLAVGLGVGQFEGGGLEGGAHTGLYNRLLEIQKESENISFVRKYFRN